MVSISAVSAVAFLAVMAAGKYSVLQRMFSHRKKGVRLLAGPLWPLAVNAAGAGLFLAAWAVSNPNAKNHFATAAVATGVYGILMSLYAYNTNVPTLETGPLAAAMTVLLLQFAAGQLHASSIEDVLIAIAAVVVALANIVFYVHGLRSRA